jgi:hypothetical protein
MVMGMGKIYLCSGDICLSIQSDVRERILVNELYKPVQEADNAS